MYPRLLLKYLGYVTEVFWIIGPMLVAFLEPLAHHQNAASLSFFKRYCFGRYPYEHVHMMCMLNLFHILVSDPLIILIGCMIFLWPFLDASFFLQTGRHWDSLLEEYFSLSYNLNGFNSSLNRQPVFFLLPFLNAFHLGLFSSCCCKTTPCKTLVWSKSQLKK